MTGYQAGDLRLAVESAIRAPSLHNSQPWRFRLTGDGAIELLPDPERRLAVAGRSGWAERIACGAAAFNARIALAAAGRPATVTFRPEPAVAARLVPAAPRPGTYAEAELAAAIPRRHSNRQPFRPDPVEPAARARLIEAARAENAWLDLLVGSTALRAVTEIARAADVVLRRDPGYLAELLAWADAGAAPDGVPSRAAAPTPRGALPVRPYGIEDHGRDQTEPLVAVLGGHGDTPADQLAAGAALQRVLLTACDAGLAASLVSQPIEVPAAREQLRRSLARHAPPQMVLRLGHGLRQAPAPRRPAADVIIGFARPEPAGPPR